MRAGANSMSFDIAGDARAHRLTDLARASDRQLALARGRDNRRRNDVLGGLLDRGGKVKRFVRAPSRRRFDLEQPRAADRQGACLVENDGADLRQPLQRRAPFS
jgi:hypothetical protein